MNHLESEANKQESPMVALVSGASRGIGAAIALKLALNGMRVIGTATTQSGADKISTNLHNFTGSQGQVLDVTDGVAVDALVADVVKKHGGLHVLVNNAGITRDNISMRLKDEEWDAVLDANLKGAFRLCRAAMRPMLKQRYGRIVSITSVVGSTGNLGQANYAAAKAGLVGMSRSFAKELGSRNITVNCVAPGFIDTDMTSKLPEAQMQSWLSQIPMGRFGYPEEIASAVAFLASPDAAYITGQELHVNGGMYA